MNSDGMEHWLNESKDAQVLLNTIFALIHPKLHSAAQKTLSDLRQHPDSAKWANRWTSVFSGIAVIYNRIAPAHVDRWSSPSWYDLLVILGNFDESRMELNNLGLSFKHTQGTVLAFCGKVLRHSVPDWSHGDRVCYAHFLRKSTVEYFSNCVTDWMTQDLFLEHLQ